MTGRRRKPPGQASDAPARVEPTRAARGAAADDEPVAPSQPDAGLPRSRDVVPEGGSGRRASGTAGAAVGASRRGSAATAGPSRRRRVVLVVVLAVFLVAVAATAWWLLGVRDAGGGDTAGVAPPAPQRTLLVQVTEPEGFATANALLGVDSAGRRGAILLIPSRLVVDVEGAGPVSFGSTLSPDALGASAAALSELLGVRVDGAWILTSQALAALVDRVGGVQAQVDVDVVTQDASGRQTLLVSAGPQELSGAEAAAYATYSIDGEPELAKLARFNEVLSGVLRRLPDERAELAVTLAALRDARATLPAQVLEGTLARFRDAAARGNVLPDVLPVNEIVVEGQPRAYGVDPVRTHELVRASFATALKRSSSSNEVRVLVQDGVGTPGRLDQVRARLVDAGFRFVNGGRAAGFGSAETLVFIPDNSRESRERAREVAATLGVAGADVKLADGGQSVADVIVIIGDDIKP